MSDDGSVDEEPPLEEAEEEAEDPPAEYVPMAGPLEFDTKEERVESFQQLLLAAYTGMDYSTGLKREVWKTLENLCVYDARWSAKPSMTVEEKKEMFEAYKEFRRKQDEREQRQREKEEVSMKSLIYAASSSDQNRAPEKIKMLVRMGTDPNCRLPRTKKQVDIKPSKNGKTAMYAAAKHGRIESIKVLHSLGADVDLPKDNGCTPVYVAAEHNQPAAIALLHSLGADVNQPKKDGFTPMLIASQNGNVECVRALHAAGADIHQANKVGQTPLSHAVQKGDAHIEEFLRGLGAELGTEDLVLETVDDIITFFEVLGMLPAHIPNFKKNLRAAEVYGSPLSGDALFAVEGGDEMRMLLDEEMHDTWGFAFRDIVQHHKSWQERRTKERAEEAQETP